MTEEWREVPGFSGYEVSDQGRMRSWRGFNGKPRGEPRYLKLTVNKWDYHTVQLRRDGETYGALVKYVVAAAFLADVPRAPFIVAHVRGMRDDRVANLEYAILPEGLDVGTISRARQIMFCGAEAAE